MAAEPNAGHRALVELERQGKLHALLTQNIDGLHQAAGIDPDLVVEVHGTMREVVCLDCDERAPMERALDRVRAGEEDPPCRTCGGILKSATVSFGQSLDPDDLMPGRAGGPAGATCSLAVGTTLTVYPIASRPPDRPSRRAPGWSSSTPSRPTTTIGPTPSCEGQIGEILPAIFGPGPADRELRGRPGNRRRWTDC